MMVVDFSFINRTSYYICMEVCNGYLKKKIKKAGNCHGGWWYLLQYITMDINTMMRACYCKAVKL